MELTDLQCGSFLKKKKNVTSVYQFYIQLMDLSAHQIPRIIHLACQICATFGSTYVSE